MNYKASLRVLLKMMSHIYKENFTSSVIQTFLYGNSVTYIVGCRGVVQLGCSYPWYNWVEVRKSLLFTEGSLVVGNNPNQQQHHTHHPYSKNW